MNTTTRRTRACTIETLDEKLRAAIRSHGREFGLQDLETDVLMCCETLSAWQRKGFQGGIQTSLSAVYVTPKWLVWVDSSHENDTAAGTAQLRHIDLNDNNPPDRYHAGPEQGFILTARYTDRNRTGPTFIVLDSGVEGKKFRKILHEALSASRTAM